MAQFSEEGTGAEQASAITGTETRMSEAAQLEVQLATDRRLLAPRRQKLAEAVRLVGSSPVEAQLEFIKGLLENPSEAQEFTSDPKKYAVDHGVLLDPGVVREVTNSLLFEVNVDNAAVSRFGSRGTQALLDMRSNHSLAAIPAAVAAGAAAVVAVAAVVEAVVTVVRAKHVQDLFVLKGLGPHGIIMPGGTPFRF